MAEQPARDTEKPEDSSTKGATQDRGPKPADPPLAPKGRRRNGDDVSEAPESGDKNTSGGQ